MVETLESSTKQPKIKSIGFVNPEDGRGKTTNPNHRSQINESKLFFFFLILVYGLPLPKEVFNRSAMDVRKTKLL